MSPEAILATAIMAVLSIFREARWKKKVEERLEALEKKSVRRKRKKRGGAGEASPSEAGTLDRRSGSA